MDLRIDTQVGLHFDDFFMLYFIILMSYFQYFAQLCLTLPTLLSPTWTKPREQPLALLLRPLVLVVCGLVLDPGLLWSVPSQPCNGSSMTVLRYVMSEITSSRNSDKNFRRSLLLWLNSDRQRLKYRNGEKEGTLMSLYILTSPSMFFKQFKEMLM